MTETTITDDQIWTLRTEASACRDYHQVELCDHALGGHRGSRAKCARAIEAAQAEEAHQAEVFGRIADDAEAREESRRLDELDALDEANPWEAAR